MNIALGLLAGLGAHLLVGPRRWVWRAAALGRAGPTGRRPPDPRPSGRPRRPRRPRRGRPSDRATPSDLVECIDLLFVATTSGLSLARSIGAVGGHGSGPLARALEVVDREIRRGAGLSDALEAMAVRLGPSVRPLTTTLIAAASSGAPTSPALQRLADAERQRNRRRLERQTRRLPVLLLGPLVGLVLPAFVLLTVVPVGLTILEGPF